MDGAITTVGQHITEKRPILAIAEQIPKKRALGQLFARRQTRDNEVSDLDLLTLFRGMNIPEAKQQALVNTAIGSKVDITSHIENLIQQDSLAPDAYLSLMGHGNVQRVIREAYEGLWIKQALIHAGYPLEQHVLITPQAVEVHKAGLNTYEIVIVFPTVQATPLDTIMQSGRLSKAHIQKTLQNLLAVVEQLEILHEYGVVHRDVHPRNLLIDEKLQVYLIDFGLVVRNDLTLNTLDALAYLYCAPERHQTAFSKLSHPIALDIFGLGVICAELLLNATKEKADEYIYALQRYYSIDHLGENGKGLNPIGALAYAQRTEGTELINEFADILIERGFCAQEAVQLQNILSCALEKQPHYRPARATDLIRELLITLK